MADTNDTISEQQQDSPLLLEKNDGILTITINRIDLEQTMMGAKTLEINIALPFSRRKSR